MCLRLLPLAFAACSVADGPSPGPTTSSDDDSYLAPDPNQIPSTLMDASVVETGAPEWEGDAAELDGAVDGAVDDDAAADAAEAALGAMGQVAYFPFDDADAVARDQSGKGHDGTYVGTSFLTPPDQSYPERVFNGIGDYVLVPPAREVLVTGEMSILVWVKTRDPVAGDGPQQREILYRGGANVVFGWEKEVIEYHTWLRCYVSSSYRPRVYQEVDLRDDDMALRDGRWHHYAVVFRPGDLLDLYVDGQKRVHTSAAAVTQINTTSGDNSYSIGAKYVNDTGELSRALAGSLAHMRWFNTALSAETIATAFRYGL